MQILKSKGLFIDSGQSPSKKLVMVDELIRVRIEYETRLYVLDGIQRV